jgi:DNA-binding GntR family transcriptional regulator
MQTKVDKKEFGLLYLATIQSLSEELAHATAAIARNDLAALERHIAAQQGLCAQLFMLQRTFHPLMRDCSTWPTIAAALRTLKQRNRVFSTLLAMSGRSHRVLLALCNAFSSRSADRDLTVRKLSCEV